MKASELVLWLEQLISMEGDVEVRVDTPNGHLPAYAEVHEEESRFALILGDDE